jgi:serine O-acetyltransferase
MKTMLTTLSKDILMIRSYKKNRLSDLFFIFHPRMLPIVLFRLSNFFSRYKLGIIGKIIAMLNQIIFGCDIARNAKIEAGLYLPHPVGVVVGEHVVIGKNCILHQGVTLGDRGELHEGSDPVLGDFIEVGTGAKILGAINIGNYARIGANSVVLKDIENYGIAVGIPAKTISFRNDIRKT